MARTTIHSLDVSEVAGQTKEGLSVADQVLNEGREKRAEVQQRRKSVALFSLLVLAVVLSLYFYIRENGEGEPADR